MTLQTAIENRLAVCALMLMLAPYGIALPTFVEALKAQAPTHAEHAVQPLHQAAMPPIHAGGTIMFPPQRTVWRIVDS